MSHKLQVGDIIKVHGWVMLRDLEDGCSYRIARIFDSFGRSVYEFSKPRGRKRLFGHYADSVDSWINDRDDNNRIELVTSLTTDEVLESC